MTRVMVLIGENYNSIFRQFLTIVIQDSGLKNRPEYRVFWLQRSHLSGRTADGRFKKDHGTGH